MTQTKEKWPRNGYSHYETKNKITQLDDNTDIDDCQVDTAGAAVSLSGIAAAIAAAALTDGGYIGILPAMLLFALGLALVRRGIKRIQAKGR